MMKVLNLYAGIGGNRKLWTNVDVTAIEIKPEIAKIYQDFFPNDKVIITDAHQFLLEHFEEFDFIWSSPPCPSHSRMVNLKMQQRDKGYKPKFPDMKLYEEIIFLSHWFKGKFCVENVISYYNPLIKPQISDNHYFWCNFNISTLKRQERGIRTQTVEVKEKKRFDLSKFPISNSLKENLLNNCVLPEVGLHIFKMAFNDRQQSLSIPPSDKSEGILEEIL